MEDKNRRVSSRENERGQNLTPENGKGNRQNISNREMDSEERLNKRKENSGRTSSSSMDNYERDSE